MTEQEVLDIINNEQLDINAVQNNCLEFIERTFIDTYNNDDPTNDLFDSIIPLIFAHGYKRFGLQFAHGMLKVGAPTELDTTSGIIVDIGYVLTHAYEHIITSLKQEIEDLKDELRYRPGGSGMLEAKEQ